MKRPLRFFKATAALGVVLWLGLASTENAAYPTYDTGCEGCHGIFETGNYISKSDSQAWGTDLMSGHMIRFIPGGCDVCHQSGPKGTVVLDNSTGEGGLAAIGCVGCHGRDEGSGPTGSGLRQHHWNSGITECGDASCHPDDSDPNLFTTVGENVLPEYYANPGVFSTTIPSDPCNRGPEYKEDILGMAGVGLDNDGDGVYDESDSDCVSSSINESVAYNSTLDQNFPNPFNPNTTIRFTLEYAARVRLDVFSANGKLVRTLVSHEFPAGVHDVTWDGQDWAGNLSSSGMYFYRMQSGKEQLTRRMVLLK